MFENLDPTLLARIQFAFTISFHILFLALTIGLASRLAVLEGRRPKTAKFLTGNFPVLRKTPEAIYVFQSFSSKVCSKILY